MKNSYEDFLQEKEIVDCQTGFDVSVSELNPILFDWQALIVKWALKRGRAAVFAGCGLGKTFIQLVWAEQVIKFLKGKNSILILAPLAVSEQTRREGEKIGIKVNVCGSQVDVLPGINITNYEKLHKFDVSYFCGIVLDESSILKHFQGAIRNQIIESFKNTSYRLACTATPAPNDWVELGNHSEFLGVMMRSEMLSTFFINDTSNTGTWRLKGHVQGNLFWKWLASWAVMISSPADLGFEGKSFKLPEITYHEHIIKSEMKPSFGFFNLPVTDLNSRRKVRKETIDLRCAQAAEIINSNKRSIWVVWVNLNLEGETMSSLIDSSVEIAGRHSDEQKSKNMLDFAEGKIKVLVTKPSIAGHGMNWQVCNKAAFVGLSDSWEQFFQATRRIWRFGQTKPVEIHIFIEEREISVLKNIKNKDDKAQQMIKAMIEYTAELCKQSIVQSSKIIVEYNPKEKMRLPKWMN